MHEMKDSGVEWIGEIPDHWTLSKVGLFYNVVLGKMLQPEKNKVSDTFENYLCAANLGNNTLKLDAVKQMWFSEKDRQQYDVRKGDLLVVEGGDVASCDIVRDEVSKLYIQNALHRVRAKSDFLLEYLRYSLIMAKTQGYISLICNKATIAHFTKDKFLSLPFLVIPVDEQERIVSYLDQKCTQVDTIVANVQAQIEKLKAYKQSLITEVVTRGLDLTVPMKDSGVEWLGQVPEHWGVHRIANLYEERSESGLPELPILTVSINTGVSDHEIADKDKDRVFIRIEDRTKYKRVYPGDLTYNMMRAWQGAFGAVRVDGLVSPAYVVAKPKKTIPLDSRYIEALLRTPVAIEEMHRYSRGIIDFRLRLYWPEFKNICICLPPIEEQSRIADYIDEFAAKVDALIAIKQAKIEKLEQYKKSLIYEYVTGKRESNKTILSIDPP